MTALQDGSIAFFYEDCYDNTNTTAYDLLFQQLSIESITGGEYAGVTPLTPQDPGDLNHEGFISIADVIYMIKLILDQCSAEDYAAADIDEDNSISIADMVSLRYNITCTSSLKKKYDTGK